MGNIPKRKKHTSSAGESHKSGTNSDDKTSNIIIDQTFNNNSNSESRSLQNYQHFQRNNFIMVNCFSASALSSQTKIKTPAELIIKNEAKVESSGILIYGISKIMKKNISSFYFRITMYSLCKEG